eukprot:101539_1
MWDWMTLFRIPILAQEHYTIRIIGILLVELPLLRFTRTTARTEHYAIRIIGGPKYKPLLVRITIIMLAQEHYAIRIIGGPKYKHQLELKFNHLYHIIDRMEEEIGMLINHIRDLLTADIRVIRSSDSYPRTRALYHSYYWSIPLLRFTRTTARTDRALCHSYYWWTKVQTTARTYYYHHSRTRAFCHSYYWWTKTFKTFVLLATDPATAGHIGHSPMSVFLLLLFSHHIPYYPRTRE